MRKAMIWLFWTWKEVRYVYAPVVWQLRWALAVTFVIGLALGRALAGWW